MSDLPKRPMLIELEDTFDPSGAEPVPDALPEGRAMQAVAGIARVRSPLGRLAVWVFSGLFSFVLSVAAYDFVTGLLERSPALGWFAFVLTLLAVALLVVFALRELAGFARLARLDGLRAAAEAAHDAHDLKAARQVVAGLQRLYGGRVETAWGRQRLSEREAELLDADALLALAEMELLTPLDALARAEVEKAARQVATVTALVPMALADVAAALYSNLAMIRRIAEIYGGRAGSFGSMRLLRRVFSALIATGAVALTDDLIGSVAGGGILAKLSRRFGEGVVNGALTARVGVAAMETCRPLPFRGQTRPNVSSLVSRALAGLFGRP